MSFKHNQKVWVIGPTGDKRPARTVTKTLHKRMGINGLDMPVWYVKGNGYAGWEHAVTISVCRLLPRD